MIFAEMNAENTGRSYSAGSEDCKKSAVLVSPVVPPRAALALRYPNMNPCRAASFPASRFANSFTLCFAVLLLVLVLAGCRKPGLPALEPISHPELGGVEEAVRQQLGDARAAADAAIAAGEPAAAAGALGKLGELYLAYGHFQAAASALRSAELLDPGSFTWPYELGLTAKAAGDAATARGHFERALAKNPGYTQAQAHLAENALAAGDAAAARALLPSFASKIGFEAFAADLKARLDGAAGATGQAGNGASFPDPLRERIAGMVLAAGSLLERGQKALADGRLPEAESTFRRGIEANPDHLELRFGLAEVLLRQGRFEDALVTLNEAIGRNGKVARAHHDLGTVYRARNQNEEAIAAFRQAIALDPAYASAWFNLANALIALERWDEAGPAVDKTLELTPQDSRARYLRAMVLRAKGQVPAAIDLLRTLVTQEPGNRVAREGLTDTLAAAGKIPEALAVYRTAASLPGVSAEEAIGLLDDAAKLAWRKNLRDQSVLLWRQGIEKNPASAKAHLNLGNGLQLLNRRQEAEAELAKAVELEPADANARLSLAALRIQMGNFAAAKADLEAGLALQADQPALMNTLARLLATAPEAALRDGRRALELAQRSLGLESRIETAETVGMALAEMGQFEQAIRWQSSLAQQAQQRNDRQALARLVATLRQYEKRQPIRATISR